ncbi:hypothetical protein [Brachybacterium subflavum]|nr:hypothetical protein [Brachybacterium subflavum]
MAPSVRMMAVVVIATASDTVDCHIESLASFGQLLGTAWRSAGPGEGGA